MRLSPCPKGIVFLEGYFLVQTVLGYILKLLSDAIRPKLEDGRKVIKKREESRKRNLFFS